MQRGGRENALLQPAGHGQVGQVHDVVAVHVCEEDRGECVREDAHLGEPQGGRASRVELQGDVALQPSSGRLEGGRPSGEPLPQRRHEAGHLIRLRRATENVVVGTDEQCHLA